MPKLLILGVYSKLIAELQSYEVNAFCFWIGYSFLTGRTQFVKIVVACSPASCVISGVPKVASLIRASVIYCVY